MLSSHDQRRFALIQVSGLDLGHFIWSFVLEVPGIVRVREVSDQCEATISY